MQIDVRRGGGVCAFQSRVARWFAFKPKIPIWRALELKNVCRFYDHLE
jgi:hypothetical protein